MDDELDEVLSEFLVESHEGLDQVEQDLLALENDAGTEVLARIFRAIHSLKGTCGFLGFVRLESLSHAGENLLSALRGGELEVTTPITDALLAMSDSIRALLNDIESEGKEGDRDVTRLRATLEELLENGGTSADEEELSAGVASAENEPSVSKPAPLSVVPEPPPAVEAPREESSPAPKSAAKSSTERKEQSQIAESSVRVSVDLLDQLMNLVGELVLARNQILQHSTRIADPTLTNTSQRLSLVTTELQAGVMKTRMQPIQSVWNKYPRVLRDLCRACGKEATLELEGKETELDRTIIEAIKDPMIHLVRNAVDHGLEHPDEREALGKPRQGKVVLRAYHEGGQVNIEMSDDGRGIDVAKVKELAISRGVVTAAQADRMSDRDACLLIFAPGFSTAEKVTNVSGRGVGMDVVKTNIERIGGTIDIMSVRGVGTTLKIKIPLTLAIIPALIVHSAKERFAIPQVNLRELVRVDAGSSDRIDKVGDVPLLRLRGRLLPLVNLRQVLGSSEEWPSAVGSDIIVLSADEREFGLVVDETADTEEIVVKPLGTELSALGTYAGATIMGDGKVALILDVLGIAAQSGVLEGEIQSAIADATAQQTALLEEGRSLLLVRTVEERVVGLPLEDVERLERIDPALIERVGAHEVVRRDGEILPLIHAAPILYGQQFDLQDDDQLHVSVFRFQGRVAGVVLGPFVDVVEEAFELDPLARRVGVLGSAALSDRVVEVLDLEGLVASVLGNGIQSALAAE